MEVPCAVGVCTQWQGWQDKALHVRQKDMQAVCSRRGCAAQGEAGREVLREAVGDGEYFLVLLPDGGRLVHAITRGEKHPITFGREVCTHHAGMPASRNGCMRVVECC